MRNYNFNTYISLVENIQLPEFNNYIKNEINFINSIDESKNKTFIEFGAGYGRIFPYIESQIKDYIGVEINPEMFSELEKRALNSEKMASIHQDILNINNVHFPIKNSKCVVLLLQNTLGTIEGNLNLFLDELKIFSHKNKVELVISVLKAESMKSLGLDFYKKIENICGEIDVQKSDINNGVFVSQTGYESKWWKKKDIIKIISDLDPINSSVSEFENSLICKLYF